MVYLTIIPRAHIRYVLIGSQPIIISYPTSTSGIIVLLKDNQEILPDLADFLLQEQLQHHLMVAISQAWYNGSCTMATKPIKSLDLHYTMIQFLMKEYRQ